MKNLFILALMALPIVTKAQTTTNIAYRITVETVTAGVTNSVNTNFRYDWGVNTKDGLKIAGLASAFATYRAGGGQNDFGQWLKTDIGDRAKAYADVKTAADNAVIAAKIQTLLLSNPDLLSASDLSNLTTIAAKAP